MAFTLRRHDEASVKVSVAKRTAAYLKEKEEEERAMGKEKKNKKQKVIP
jgi:hypothetical protein